MRIKFKHSKSWKRINYLLKKFRRGEHNCEWLGNFYSERRSGRSASRKLKASLIAECTEKKKEKMSRCFVRQEEQTETKLLRKLSNIDQSTSEIGTGTRLNSMKFMQTAEAARKKENDAAVEFLRRDLAGEDPSSDEVVEQVGRKKYGPGSTRVISSEIQDTKLRDFEEPLTSDGEDQDKPEEDSIEVITVSKHPKRPSDQRSMRSNTTSGTMHGQRTSNELPGSGLFKLAD